LKWQTELSGRQILRFAYVGDAEEIVLGRVGSDQWEGQRNTGKKFPEDNSEKGGKWDRAK